MTMTAAELVASKKHILLDFDGPICAAFAGYGAANISRQLATLLAMEGIDVPPELSESLDPFTLLRYAADLGDPDVLIDLEAEFRRLETQAVRVAPQTAGAKDLIQSLASSGHTVSIVSNNSELSVATYARLHDFEKSLDAIAARIEPEPSLLKPNPHLVLTALCKLGANGSDTVMVGDSVTDVQAAHLAGISVIALANRPGKTGPLSEAGPNAIVSSVAELT